MNKTLAQKDFSLTTSQKEAFAQIIGFLNSPESCFLLKGYAGTGKTYLIKIIARYLDSIGKPFFLAAPTGRAARILGSKTGYEAATIHSLIYTEDKGDVEAQKISASLSFSMRKNIHPINAVYIVDEASMIADSGSASEYLNFGSGRLLSDFFIHAGLIEPKGKIPTKRKIIFVGDPAQLPPVKQESSPALQANYLFKEYGVSADEITLSEVIRQSEESPILQIATPLRTAIHEQNYEIDALPYSDSLICPSNEFIKSWQQAVYKDTIDDIIVITRSNESALRYNQTIRRLRYGAKDSSIQRKDKLLVVNNNRLYNLLNGDIIEVVEVSKQPEVHVGTNIFNNNEKHELYFRDIIVGWKDAAGEFTEMECKIVENLLWSSTGSMPSGEWAAMRNLATELCGIPYPSKRTIKKKPKEYKEKLAEYTEAMKQSPYMNALQVKFGYAVTCHKAQGGEWKNVFVDFKSFGNYLSEEYFRWAYTAITRAKEELFMMNFPINNSNKGFPLSEGIRYDYNVD